MEDEMIEITRAVAKRIHYIYGKWAHAVELKGAELENWCFEMAGLGYSVAVKEQAQAFDESRAPFMTFVYLKARMSAREYLKSRTRHLKVKRILMMEPERPPPQDELEGYLLREELKEIFKVLSDQDRQALCYSYSYIYGLKPDAIAQRMNKPVNTIYSILRRALSKARQMAEQLEQPKSYQERGSS